MRTVDRIYRWCETDNEYWDLVDKLEAHGWKHYLDHIRKPDAFGIYTVWIINKRRET